MTEHSEKHQALAAAMHKALRLQAYNDSTAGGPAWVQPISFTEPRNFSHVTIDGPVDLYAVADRILKELGEPSHFTEIGEACMHYGEPLKLVDGSYQCITCRAPIQFLKPLGKR